MKSKTRITSVPTHIVTGFLGAGKTTLILHLLKTKPEQERWAILVNEFGEMGLDGAFIQANANNQVFVREVPGGCMCCTSGVSMSVALNQLLSQAKPDRLIIEPTGLGHPREVLQTLKSEHYRDVIDIQHTITLVDARKLDDTRYTTHPTFLEQIAVADIIIGSKSDLYEAQHTAQLSQFIQDQNKTNTPILFIENGQLSLEQVSQASNVKIDKPAQTATSFSGFKLTDDERSKEPAAIIKNTAHSPTEKDYQSISLQLDSNLVFDSNKAAEFLASIEAERVKAILKTENGIALFNLTRTDRANDSQAAKPKFIEYADTNKENAESEAVNRLEVIVRIEECGTGEFKRKTEKLEQGLKWCVL